MTQKEYRAAIDAVRLSEDFQERTVRRLEQQVRKELPAMKKARTILFAACLAAVLIGSVAAAVHMLTPGEVAAFHGNETLAAAFAGEDAVVLDQTAECGEYTFRLAGMVSGAGLSDFCPDADASRSYLVVSRARTDGTPIQEAAITDYTGNLELSFLDYSMDEKPKYTVDECKERAGCLPWQVNIWTLGGSVSAFLRDGVVYYIYEFDSIEMFAGHTVYLAVYEGGRVPSAEVMTMAEDGSISYNPDFTAPHAIFEVPLDPSKADPAAVDAFLSQFAE